MDNFELFIKTCEYPFAREGMTKEEYQKEYEYYGKHRDDVRKGTYKPLWQQKK